MTRDVKHNGFSLTEVLLATGILAIGMVMIAMVFPVGVKLTSIATERTVAATAANEAFAKILLYGKDPDGAGILKGIDLTSAITNTIAWTECRLTFNAAYSIATGTEFPSDQQWYPSESRQEKKYRWVAMVRKLNTSQLQTTVFVMRLLMEGALYYKNDGTAIGSEPESVLLNIKPDNSVRQFNIVTYTTQHYENNYLTVGSVLLENKQGGLYRVVEIKDVDNDGVKEVILDKDLTVADPWCWVIPPAVGSTRNPCIGVYQRILTF
jgi:prepilin-type N-terminal cleavage/methylation domain-containing protein